MEETQIDTGQWMELMSVMKEGVQATKSLNRSIDNIHYELRMIANKR